jgi:hypothetical protein
MTSNVRGTIGWDARTQRKQALLAHPGYSPARLLNHAAALLKARSDNHLSEMLEFDHGQLSRIKRKQDCVVTAGLMVNIMDRTGWTIAHVRELAGMPHDLEMRA